MTLVSLQILRAAPQSLRGCTPQESILRPKDGECNWKYPQSLSVMGIDDDLRLPGIMVTDDPTQLTSVNGNNVIKYCNSSRGNDIDTPHSNKIAPHRSLNESPDVGWSREEQSHQAVAVPIRNKQSIAVGNMFTVHGSASSSHALFGDHGLNTDGYCVQAKQGEQRLRFDPVIQSMSEDMYRKGTSITSYENDTIRRSRYQEKTNFSGDMRNISISFDNSAETIHDKETGACRTIFDMEQIGRHSGYGDFSREKWFNLKINENYSKTHNKNFSSAFELYSCNQNEGRESSQSEIFSLWDNQRLDPNNSDEGLHSIVKQKQNNWESLNHTLAQYSDYPPRQQSITFSNATQQTQWLQTLSSEEDNEPYGLRYQSTSPEWSENSTETSLYCQDNDPREIYKTQSQIYSNSQRETTKESYCYNFEQKQRDLSYNDQRYSYENRSRNLVRGEHQQSAFNYISGTKQMDHRNNLAKEQKRSPITNEQSIYGSVADPQILLYGNNFDSLINSGAFLQDEKNGDCFSRNRTTDDILLPTANYVKKMSANVSIPNLTLKTSQVTIRGRIECY